MEFVERRRFKRISVDCIITLSSMEDKNEFCNVHVVDICGGGICFTCSNDFNVGDNFIINLPTISIPLYVVWKQGERYGAMFTHPLADESELLAHSICEEIEAKEI